MLRVRYQELFDALLRELLKLNFDSNRAIKCAQLFAEASRDGVYSHGLNRFPLFVSMVRSGVVDVNAEPVMLAGHGPLERWDGKSGPGVPNFRNCWCDCRKHRSCRLRRGFVD